MQKIIKILLMAAMMTSAAEAADVTAPPAVTKKKIASSFSLDAAMDTTLRGSVQKCKRETCLKASLSFDVTTLDLKDPELSLKGHRYTVAVTQKKIIIKITLLSW